MTNSSEPLAAIMRRLCELGSTFEFRSSTNNVWTAAECFLGPDDLESATATVIEEFGADVLLSCRILHQQDEGSPRIKPEFGQAAGPMIGLTFGNPDSFRLMTQASASIIQPLPLMSALRDLTTLQRLKRRRGILLLTETVGEAAVLRTLGLPAAPAGPLQCLNSEKLKELAASFRKTGRLFKDVRGVEFTPVLADWHPTGASAPQQSRVHDLALFLGQADRSLGIDFGDVAVWHPSRAERDEFEFVIRSGDEESLWSAVYSSIESSSYAVEGFDASEIERRERPSDWRQALQRVLELVDGEANPQWAECVAMYFDLVARDLVEPVHVRSSKTKDPLQKILLVHAAETTRTLQMQLPAIHRHLASLATGRDRGANEDLLMQLSQRHQSVRDLLRLVKEIRK